MTDEGFASRLAWAIRKKRLNQDALAAALEVSPSTVSRWLSGIVPRKIALAGLAGFLGVDPAWLTEAKGQENLFSLLSPPDWALVPQEYLDRPESFSDEEVNQVMNAVADAKRKKFGERLAGLREALGIGLRDFAEQCGISAAYLSRIEGGVYSNPSAQTVDKIMAVFPVSREWLVFGELPILVSENQIKNFKPALVKTIKAMDLEERGKHESAVDKIISDTTKSGQLDHALFLVKTEMDRIGMRDPARFKALRKDFSELLQAKMGHPSKFTK